MNYRFPSFRIFQFAKAPRGRPVKTRLAPTLSPQQRVELHSAMTRWVCRQVCESHLAPLSLWVDGDPYDPLFEQVATSHPLHRETQQGENLGERLGHAAATGLEEADGVILLGSDCPFIDADYLAAAIDAMNRGQRAVIGPAADGGYVLLGLTATADALFADIAWGGEHVFAQTCQRLQTLEWPFEVLPVLCDIDRPEDLVRLEHANLPPELRRFARLRI